MRSQNKKQKYWTALFVLFEGAKKLHPSPSFLARLKFPAEKKIWWNGSSALVLPGESTSLIMHGRSEVVGYAPCLVALSSVNLSVPGKRASKFG